MRCHGRPIVISNIQKYPGEISFDPAGHSPKLKRRRSWHIGRAKRAVCSIAWCAALGCHLPIYRSTPIDNIYSKKRPTVPSPHGLRRGLRNGRDAEAESSTPRH